MAGGGYGKGTNPNIEYWNYHRENVDKWFFQRFPKRWPYAVVLGFIIPSALYAMLKVDIEQTALLRSQKRIS